MSKRMYENDVKRWISEHRELYLSELVDSFDVKLIKDFRKADKALKKALDDIRKYFPDAHYYTSGGDSLCLLLGRSHDDNGVSQQELFVEQGIAKVDGGDW